MNRDTLDRIRRALSLHRDTLLEWLDSDTPRKALHLHGTDSQEVLHILADLRQALERIDRGEFGRCQECDGEVEEERLEFDFTTSVCLDHYNPAQLRSLENELEHIAKVQRRLLPRSVPALNGIQTAVHSESARVVGGDYYDFFRYRHGGHGLAIADVMGKGLPAGILMSNLQASLRILGPEHDSPEALAHRLNAVLAHNVNLMLFISMFLAEVDVETKTLRYCNAGHHPPLWWDSQTQSCHWLMPTGPALGLTPEPTYSTATLTLHPGDVLLLYTDGLVEARNANGTEFGEDRLEARVRQHYQLGLEDLLASLRDEVLRFAGRFHDDMTLMALRVE